MIVYPNGTGKKKNKLLTWNGGDCCGYAIKNNIDDVGFISKLIDYMIIHHKVNKNKIFITGHSNGAKLSYKLSCELGSKIKAIVASSSTGQSMECVSSPAVSILHVHGKKDPCSKYEGGKCGGCFQEFFNSIGVKLPPASYQYHPVEEFIQKKVEAYGCNKKGRQDLIRDSVNCMIWENCKDGANIGLCSIGSGGHTWAGGKLGFHACEKSPDGYICKKFIHHVGGVPANEFNTSEYAWKFFKQFL